MRVFRFVLSRFLRLVSIVMLLVDISENYTMLVSVFWYFRMQHQADTAMYENNFDLHLDECKACAILFKFHSF